MQSNLIELFQYSFLLFSLTSHKLAYIILINYQAEKRGYSYLFINMLKKHNELFLSILFIGDLFMVSFSWLFAYYLRFYEIKLIPVTKGLPPIRGYLYLLVFLLLITGWIFKSFKLYVPRRHSLDIDEFFCIVKATVSLMVIIGFITFFYRDYSYSRVVMAYFCIVNIASMTVVRGTIRKILKFFRKRGYNLRWVLIAGAGEAAVEIIQKIKEHPELGFRIQGYLDDNITSLPQSLHAEYLGRIGDLKFILSKNKIDQIFIAFPLSAGEQFNRCMEQLKDEIVDIKIIPDIYQFLTLNAGVEDFLGMPIINISEGPLYGWNQVIKRFMDIVFSLAAIIIFHLVIPLMPLIYLLTKLTSNGPVFYKQERMGLDGKRFNVYKIRTMKVDAEKETGAVWANPDDPRRTKFGSFLRETSLDEFPQLFNVLKGEMSLVGPRPERPVFVDKFKKTIPKYMLRHKIKAGCTGWAQVNGWRGNTSLEKRIEYDLYYLENWSLLFDLKILWLTLWKGLINKNAY